MESIFVLTLSKLNQNLAKLHQAGRIARNEWHTIDIETAELLFAVIV